MGQRLPEDLGAPPPVFGQRYVGPAGVLAGPAPLGLAMADENELGLRHGVWPVLQPVEVLLADELGQFDLVPVDRGLRLERVARLGALRRLALVGLLLNLALVYLD